jgi:hypothetical protein
MEAADVWKILLGAVVALAGTLLAQWSSLAYQTKRQRQARRADHQEARLLALQDLLGEVEDAVARAMLVRARLSEKWEQARPDHSDRDEHVHRPDVALLRSLTYRLRLLAAGVEHAPLLVAVGHVSELALRAPMTYADEVALRLHDKLIEVQNEAADLLGDQLRRLP